MNRGSPVTWTRACHAINAMMIERSMGMMFCIRLYTDIKEDAPRLNQESGRRIRTRSSLTRIKIPENKKVFGTYVESDSIRVYILLSSRL